MPKTKQSPKKKTKRARSSQARSGTVAAIEEKLEKIAPGTPRWHALESARQFKNNWLELAERLTQVVDDKLYEQWGFASFDRYITAELRLKRETAYKLVRSYAFVSHQKPEYLKPEHSESLPPVDVIDFLSKKSEADALPKKELQTFTDQAFEESWTPRTISQRWRDLVSDDRVDTEAPEDRSVRAVRRAQELAERLNKALVEIPGLDQEAMDAVAVILGRLSSLT
jgi:hypothetical protein